MLNAISKVAPLRNYDGDAMLSRQTIVMCQRSLKSSFNQVLILTVVLRALFVLVTNSIFTGSLIPDAADRNNLFTESQIYKGKRSFHRYLRATLLYCSTVLESLKRTLQD
ncbi:hypothetical protein T10_8552 [Trichinella papuae]|uniref:Uncharacterized protein n=1 Tax=Trichinella papuae TaxID=268474 RepID=A0A0V1M7M4_9BILA|nr:hypothetical protein T10_8552 [Trichinella papuae]